MDNDNRYADVKEEDGKMYEYVETLAGMYVRREMYFKKGCRFQCLRAFEFGFSLGEKPFGEKYAPFAIPADMIEEINDELDDTLKDLSDDEQFEIYLTTFFAVFEKRFPGYANALGLGGATKGESKVQKARREREERYKNE